MQSETAESIWRPKTLEKKAALGVPWWGPQTLTMLRTRVPSSLRCTSRRPSMAPVLWPTRWMGSCGPAVSWMLRSSRSARQVREAVGRVRTAWSSASGRNSDRTVSTCRQ